MAAARLACLGLLLLLAACAHRAYYVFAPDGSTHAGTETEIPPQSCRLDFRGLTLGTSTVADLRLWYFEMRKQRACKDVKLRFHRPGTPVVGPEYSPEAADVIQQIAIDSAPERSRLTDAAVIRAVAAPRVIRGSGETCPAAPSPCDRRTNTGSETGAGTSTGTGTETETVGTGTGGTEPIEKPVEIPVERLIFVEVVKEPPAPPQPPPEEVKKQPRQQAEDKPSLGNVVAPVVIGGGLVYALAYFQMLPLGAAGALRVRPRRPRPEWSLEDRQVPPPNAAPNPVTPDLRRDPRVRIRAVGFRRGNDEFRR